jgi:hypothetical protein
MRLGIVGGLAGLLTLSRSTPCPIGRAHHAASRRCPSQPSLQACRKTIAPPASTCSLNSTDWRQELGEPRVALFKRQRSQVVAVQFEQVEPIQYDLAVEPPKTHSSNEIAHLFADPRPTPGERDFHRQ